MHTHKHIQTNKHTHIHKVFPSKYIALLPNRLLPPFRFPCKWHLFRHYSIYMSPCTLKRILGQWPVGHVGFISYNNLDCRNVCRLISWVDNRSDIESSNSASTNSKSLNEDLDFLEFCQISLNYTDLNPEICRLIAAFGR